MYSLTAVGGIQYTTEMAKQNNQIMKKRNGMKSVKSDILHTRVSEQLMVGAVGSAGTLVAAPRTDVSGIANDQFFLSPLGLTAAVLTAANYQNGPVNNVERPHLRKLNNLSLDFRRYRVLNGKLTFVPNIGSNTSGSLTMSSSADPFDLVTATAVAYSSGSSYKTFQLASNKECSIPLSVDSSWKKISSVLSCPMGPVFDGAGTSTGVVVNVASLDDLCFTAIGFNFQDAPPMTLMGTFRLDYEVEFSGIIDVAANA